MQNSNDCGRDAHIIQRIHDFFTRLNSDIDRISQAPHDGGDDLYVYWQSVAALTPQQRQARWDSLRTLREADNAAEIERFNKTLKWFNESLNQPEMHAIIWRAYGDLPRLRYAGETDDILATIGNMLSALAQWHRRDNEQIAAFDQVTTATDVIELKSALRKSDERYPWSVSAAKKVKKRLKTTKYQFLRHAGPVAPSDPEHAGSAAPSDPEHAGSAAPSDPELRDKRRGVSAFDLAFLIEEDKDAARKLMSEWRNSHLWKTSKPKSIGKDPNNARASLYELLELLEFWKKFSNPSADEVSSYRKKLREKLRSPVSH